MPKVRLSALVLTVSVGVSACASTGTQVLDRATDDIQKRTGAALRPAGAAATTIPPGLRLDDGMSRDDAVALALWNSPAFQVSVSQMGFARADLVDAGLLTNPTLSLLFPVGPKQLEATLRLPAELLWQRPKRVAAARLALDAAGQSLVQNGLDLVLVVRVAYTDLALAQSRLVLAEEAATALGRIDSLSQSRLRAGDISELDARAAHVDAVRSRQDAERLIHDVTIARERLRALLGLTPEDAALATLQVTAVVGDCGPEATWLSRSLAARPDVRAAELTVEAAAARLGWERSRVLALTAVLDANGQGLQGFEMGPGLDVGIPIFDRNQGGILRGHAGLQRASAAYLAAQRQVALDVREAGAQLAQARQSRAIWARDILTPLETNVADATDSFAAGENSYLFVLENTRRLIDARLRAREILADEERAQARLERAIGMSCQGGTE